MELMKFGSMIEGTSVVSSREVAKMFGREHKNVLRDIENEIKSLQKIINENNGSEGSKFGPSEYAESLGNLTAQNLSREIGPEPLGKFFIETGYISTRGRREKEYHLTREGFLQLTMGYQGELAAKIRYHVVSHLCRLEESYVKVLKENLKLERQLMAHAKTDAAAFADTYGLTSKDIADRPSLYPNILKMAWDRYDSLKAEGVQNVNIVSSVGWVMKLASHVSSGCMVIRRVRGAEDRQVYDLKLVQEVEKFLGEP